MAVLLPFADLRFSAAVLFAILSGVFVGCTPEPVLPPPQASPRVEVMEDDWDRFVLLLLDVQNDFWSPPAAVDFPQFPENVGNLLKIARRDRIEIIHVRTEFDVNAQADWPPQMRLAGAAGCPCLAGTFGADPTSFATAERDERVFLKSTFDGLSNPELMKLLRERNKSHILIAGLTTDVCILSTAFRAFNEGFFVSVIEDCCAADKRSNHDQMLDRYGGFFFDRVVHGDLQSMREHWTAMHQAGMHQAGMHQAGMHQAGMERPSLVTGDSS